MEVFKSVEKILVDSSDKVIHSIASSKYYSQLAVLVVLGFVAFAVSGFLRARVPMLRTEPKGVSRFSPRVISYRLGHLLFPLFFVLLLFLGQDFSGAVIGEHWLITIFLDLSILYILLIGIRDLVRKKMARTIATWTFVPLAILQFLGPLDEVATYLQQISVEIGSFKLSDYGIFRVAIIGSVLFWAGRLLNTIGQQVVRKQDDLELGTREMLRSYSKYL